MSAAWIVFLKECRESLRDRRTLTNSLLLGPLLGPLLFVMLMKVMVGREVERAEQPLPVVVIGAEYAPNLVGVLRQMGLDPQPAVADPEAAVREQRLDLALRIPADFGKHWQAGEPAEVELIYDSSRQDISSPLERLRGMLETYGRRTAALRLMARGIAPQVIAPLSIGARDQATPAARGALLFAMLPYFLVLTTFIGGMWLAIDSTAGERERQSLEPLLINPVSRTAILGGKLAATCSFSFISLTLGLLAFTVAGHLLPTQQLGMTLVLGAGFVIRALLIMLPLVVLVCLLQCLVSAFARSNREAQTWLGLLQLVPVIPSVLMSVMPIRQQLWMFCIPLAGQQLSLTRLLRGEELGTAQLLLPALATLLAVLLLWQLARRVYASERLAIST